MRNGDGQRNVLGIELRRDHIILTVRGQRVALDPTTSLALARALAHWLLDWAFTDIQVSPIVIPPH